MSMQVLRVCSAVLLVSCAALLGGCVSVLTDPGPFNAQLAPRPGDTPRLSCLSEDALSTCVLPGMKLVVLESDAREHTVQDRTLLETRTEWIIPQVGQFGQQDLFQLARLLAISLPASQEAGTYVDASRCYEAWIEKHYPDEFRSSFVPRFLETLTVRYQARAGTSAGTAQSVQEWMRGLPQPGRYAGPALYFSIPRGPADIAAECGSANGDPDLNLSAFGGGSPFQRQTGDDPYTLVKDEARAGWYRQDKPLLKSRSFVAVAVPVTVAGTPGLHYVPIYASLSDLPAYLGIPPARFKGVRRDVRLVPPELRQPQPYDDRILIRPAEGGRVLDPTALPVTPEVMSQLLVAPGDEVVMTHY